MRIRPVMLALVLTALTGRAPAHAAGGPKPGSPAFVKRDFQNMADAYGRELAPGGQLRDPNYLATLFTTRTASGLTRLGGHLERAKPPALAAGNVFPGWNTGNPRRAGWDGRRGRRV